MIHLLASVPSALLYLLVAVFVAVESVGIPLPGETALLAGSLAALHPHGPSPWGVAIAGSLGAIVGDSIGYSIGHARGDRLLASLSRRYPRHVTAARIDYARHLFHTYGPLAVTCGRFVTLLRMLSGPLAGAMHLHYWRFLLANALGAVLWAGGLVALVTLTGPLAERWFSGAGWILLALVVGAAVLGGRQAAREFDRRADRYAAQVARPAPGEAASPS